LARRRTIAIEIDARDSYGAMRMLAPARRRGVGSPRAPIRAAGTVLVCRLPCARIFQALLARPHGIAKAAPAGFQNTRSEPLFMQVLEPRQETLNVYVRYICLVRVIEDAQHLNARGPQSGCRVLVHYALLHSPRPLPDQRLLHSRQPLTGQRYADSADAIHIGYGTVPTSLSGVYILQDTVSIRNDDRGISGANSRSKRKSGAIMSTGGALLPSGKKKGRPRRAALNSA
jgi:hypothetical protein